jgi:hypothetical protein
MLRYYKCLKKNQNIFVKDVNMESTLFSVKIVKDPVFVFMINEKIYAKNAME